MTQENFRCENTFWCLYSMAVCAGGISEFITYPLDLTKTRLQIQGEIAKKDGTNTSYRGMIKTAYCIVKEEGLFSLWKGIEPALLRQFIYSGSRIVIYDTLRNDVFKKKPEEIFPFWKSAICGFTCGMLSQCLASPTDLVKVQLQMEGKQRLLGLPPRVNGPLDAFLKIIRTGGITGLWKGSFPSMQRAALVNLGDMTTYDMSKQYIQLKYGLPDEWPLQAVSSTCSGFASAALGTPADVVMTRYMNQPTDEKGRGLYYSSSWNCLKKTVNGEGFLALYKGFVPVWLRMAPWAVSFWLTFEQFKIMMSTPS